MLDQEWVKIFETTKGYEIEIIKGMLFENEIGAVIINKKDSTYLFGEFELYVTRQNIMKAKTLIEGVDS
ncbi:MAG: DUF2007 domain-containing protein [Bacteroidota bacterium]